MNGPKLNTSSNTSAGGVARTLVRAVLAAAVVLALFVSVCNYLIASPENPGPASVIKGPDDIHNLLCVAVTAFVASAVGVLIYRRPATRPMVTALSLGLIFLKLDSVAVWEQARLFTGMPPALSPETLASITLAQREKWFEHLGSILVGRLRLFSIYYMVYVSWAIIVLYSGYLGQYIMGHLLFREENQRRESALYVAENAGIGLAAGVTAGLVAITIAAGMAYFAAAAVPLAESSPEVSSERPLAPGDGDSSDANPQTLAKRPVDILFSASSRVTPIQRQKVFTGLVLIAFFVAAYVTALTIRPRASTWVACGATLGVMAAPAALSLLTLSPPYLRFAGKILPILELSPFALAGLAVTAALAGDWTARALLERARRHRTFDVYRPL